MKINDFSRIRTAPLLTDQRRVEINFAFSLVNEPRYNEMTKIIPHGRHFHPRSVIGATFVVDSWSDTAGSVANADPYVSSHFMMLLLRLSH